jgi:hypothetical protein
MKQKSFTFLLTLLLTACAQKSKEEIVGKWKYERMVVSDLKTSGDTLAQVISEMAYEGSVLEFYKNDSFAMINQDTASEFQGRGTYQFNASENTLTLQGGIKATAEDRMKVSIKELTADSLKIGNVNELMIYSRVKE